MKKENIILLAHWNGRFGNRLHQYIYGYYFSKINNYNFYLPSNWEGTIFFKNQYHKLIDDNLLRLEINQTQKALDNIHFRTYALKKFSKNMTRILVDESPNDPYKKISNHIFFDGVCAYNNKIFDPMESKEIKNIFEFSDKIKKLDVYKMHEDRQGTYNIAHLRRDDISNPQYNATHQQGYSVLSKESYFKAFKKFDFDPEKIEWVSDDYTGKWHKDRYKQFRANWKYPVGAEFIEGLGFDWLNDFLKIYFAKNIFRANSSFSWWAAFLSPCAKVYSPIIDKQLIYGRDGLKELDMDFTEGNHPHWMYNCKDILIKSN
jgi:hypothetical protein